MNISITRRFFAFALALMLAFGFFITIAYAEHPAEDDVHDDEIHETDDAHVDHHESDASASPRIAQMKQLISLLTQLAALLAEKVEMTDSHAHGDSHDEDGELKVWIEIHSNRTHAHVQMPGEELDTFFIDEFNYTEEDSIIDFIADRTGLSIHDIEAIITFPSGQVDEHGDSINEADDHADHHEEMDLSGIHIMGDGTIMLGSGVALTDATITSDGMIMLADGDIVEPEFDLR